ncbi:MAG: S8 family serine peptidase [Pirellulales bacterium]
MTKRPAYRFWPLTRRPATPRRSPSVRRRTLESLEPRWAMAADPGATLSTALDLGTLAGTMSVAGSVGGVDRADMYRFSLSAPTKVDVALSGLRSDIDLTLYNAAGQGLALSNKSGAAAESISRTLSAGVYYVEVAPWRTATSSYVLTVSTPTTPVTPTPSTPGSGTPATPGTPSTTTPVDPLPNVAYYGTARDWNLNSINAPEAWAAGYRGAGVVVAVVDTGVDISHPDLSSQIWVNPGEVAGNGIDDDRNGYIDDVRGWDFVNRDNTPTDGNGHGTHVAGIIAANDNGVGATGVAPGAKIMPVRVLGNDGSGTDTAVAAGIRYAAQNGADIINLSLGGAYSSVIQSAIQFAQQRDVLVVTAAGNESSSVPSYPGRFSATLSNVISVGAYSSSLSLAGFSNRVGSSGAVQVDAPGVGVYNAWPSGQYQTLSGTSMASPHVAGLAALALSARPSLTAAQLRSYIVQGAGQSIAGSDSLGGVNAAVTVALAAAGSSSSVASSSSASVASSSTGLGSASVNAPRPGLTYLPWAWDLALSQLLNDSLTASRPW